MKTCSRCFEPKPLKEFHKDNRAIDGTHSTCKTCRNRGSKLPDCRRCPSLAACSISVRMGGPMLMGCENGLRHDATERPVSDLIDNSGITLPEITDRHSGTERVSVGRLLISHPTPAITSAQDVSL